MSAEFFVDTNVFTCHLDSTDRRKQKVAERIVRDALVTGNDCMSSLYDALIVAEALAAGCCTLLSEDLQHGQSLESLTVIDLFR